MNKNRFIVILLILILATTSLTGCTTYRNFKEAFIDKPEETINTIQIGVYEPLTGSDSQYGELEARGIELANELYPKIGDKRIELVYGDNASDLDAAETAINNLIAKEPSVILGSYGSVYSLAVGNIIMKEKLPAIAITNTNPLVTKNNSYYFRVCYVDSNQGDLLARYVLEQKKEVVAGVVVPQNDDAAMAMTSAFTDRIRAETGNEDAIISYEQYTAGDKDFSKQLQSIKESGVRSVLLSGDAVDSAEIIKQAKKMDVNVLFLGDTDWNTDEFKKMVEGYATEQNVAFVNFFVAGEPVNEEATRFLEAYQKKYGKDKEPDNAEVLGYDAYLVAYRAIEKAGAKAKGEDIQRILAGQNQFQGASGMIAFNNVGDPIKTAYISTWKNGDVVSLYTIDPIR